LAGRGIRLWDLPTDTGSRALDITGLDDLGAVAFTPDGRRLAGATGLEVRFWRPDTGRLLSPPGHAQPVFQVLFSSDGKTLASGSLDETIRLWDVAAGRQRLELPTGYIYSPAVTDSLDAFRFTADGKAIICRTSKLHLGLHDAATGKKLVDFDPMKRERLNAAHGAAAATALHLGTTSLSGTAAVLTAAEHARKCGMYYLVLLAEYSDRPAGFSADGKILRTHSRWHDRTWDVVTGDLLRTDLSKMVLDDKGNPPTTIGPTADGRLLALVEDGRSVHLWSMPAGKPLRKLTPRGGTVRGGDFSPDGKTLALWLTPPAKDAGKKPPDGQRDVEPARGFAEAAYPPLVAQAFRDPGRRSRSVLELWTVATGKERRRLGEVEEEIVAVAFAPGGRLLASLGNGTVRLWDVTAGQLLYRSPAGPVHATSVGFSPDGRLLATGCLDGTVLVWEVATLTGARQ
jgi:WD40 repeat protein